MPALLSRGDFCEIGNFDGAGSNHFIDSEFFIVRLEVNGANRIAQEHNLEAFRQSIQNRMLDAVISGQTADNNPFDLFSPEKFGEWCPRHVSGLKPGVTIFIGRHSFRHDDNIIAQFQVVMKLRSPGSLNAVHGPETAVSAKMTGFFRMPITRREYR
jgi:hypothetical protein